MPSPAHRLTGVSLVLSAVYDGLRPYTSAEGGDGVSGSGGGAGAPVDTSSTTSVNLARFTLAKTLAELGKHAEAAEHYAQVFVACAR